MDNRIFKQNTKQLCNQIGYEFKDESLLDKALTHRSYNENNNERLEFLGDAVLSLIIAKYLYSKFPNAQEGQLSRLRAFLVKGKTLADIALELDIGSSLLFGYGEAKSGGHIRASILENAFEALIGAIYLDSNLDSCQEVVINLYGTKLTEISSHDQLSDCKSQLQEIAQARGFNLPKYKTEKTEGAEHCQTFHVVCEVKELQLSARATGNSRKEAEQLAAKGLLSQIKDD